MKIKFPENKNECQCKLCVRNRKYMNIVNSKLFGFHKLPESERRFMESILDVLINTEEDLGMSEIYIEDLLKEKQDVQGR